MTYPEFQFNEERIISLCVCAERKSEPLSVLNKISNHAKKIALTTALGLSVAGASTAMAERIPAEKSMATLKWDLVGQSDLWEYKALSSYSEAPFLSEMVQGGQLPPVKDRLPKEPLVMKTGAMVDGTGEYGGIFRHVIGGRPEGWNWLAGQHQGWGGINITLQECLVRQGPLWQVKPEEQNGPLPNLAKSWSWNTNKTSLTMNLIEGVKWSDGDAFDAEDLRFWWEDNVQDEKVTSRMPKDGMGVGTTMSVVDPYTIRFEFKEPQGPARVSALAYIQGCPGPSHILKDHHPRYNPQKSYEDYKNAQPADDLKNIVSLGMFVAVVHAPDQIVIMRRNPYYWKVDEKGNQLPYMNEMHFKLSTWSDRTTQAVAGTGDFSNMENPGNYVEALKQSQSADAPTKAQFGPRVLGWNLEFNYSMDVGVQNDVDRELRGLFRDVRFRQAISHAIDRNAVGQSIARGPFTHPWAGAFTSGSPWYDVDSINYRAYNKAGATQILDSLGIKDTDSDGIRNLPKTGMNAEIDLAYDTGEPTDKKQVDAVTSMLGEVGIRIIPKPYDDINSVMQSGNFNMVERRNHWVVPTRETCRFLPISTGCPLTHPSSADGSRDLMPFELEMVDAVNAIQQSWDADEISANARKIQQLWTDNVYTVGLVQAPAALLVNKRVKNAHPGVPVFMFEWAEDSLVRERLWVPKNQQLSELMPGVIPTYKR
jgi:peptide/nickel transport system substrate-binding protein